MLTRIASLFRVGLTIVSVFLGIAAVSIAADESYPRPDLLIEAERLAHGDLPPGAIVLDLRERGQYDAGHSPGARWIPATTWVKDFSAGQSGDHWSQMIGDLGITNASTVVLCGDQNVGQTCRVWFILRYWGLDDVRLLDGGWNAWEQAHLPIDRAVPVKNAGAFTAQARSKRMSSKQDVLGMLDRADRQVVDARSQGEFCGDEKRSNKRGGAIPGAKHLDWVELIDGQTKRFKSPTELRGLFAAAGIDPARPSVTYCQSGGRASVMMFALELMGANDVTNYYRSWAEWGNSDDTPVVPGKVE